MTGTLVVRERFALDDRTFTVLGEPWYDGEAKQWRSRLLYLPVDRSLPRGVMGETLLGATRRDELLRQLRRLSDEDLARALRRVSLPLPHRLRAPHAAAGDR